MAAADMPLPLMPIKCAFLLTRSTQPKKTARPTAIVWRAAALRVERNEDQVARGFAVRSARDVPQGLAVGADRVGRRYPVHVFLRDAALRVLVPDEVAEVYAPQPAGLRLVPSEDALDTAVCGEVLADFLILLAAAGIVPLMHILKRADRERKPHLHAGGVAGQQAHRLPHAGDDAPVLPAFLAGEDVRAVNEALQPHVYEQQPVGLCRVKHPSDGAPARRESKGLARRKRDDVRRRAQERHLLAAVSKRDMRVQIVYCARLCPELGPRCKHPRDAEHRGGFGA